MKKILSISFILILLATAASAQQGYADRSRTNYVRHGYNSGQITRGGRFELRKDAVRLQTVKHRACKDGVITPLERRRIHHLKKQTRRDVFRYKHNGRRRII